MRWRVAYQIDGHCPFVNSEADFSDKFMEMAHQTGHDLGEAGVGIGASGIDDLAGQGKVELLLRTGDGSNIDGRVNRGRHGDVLGGESRQEGYKL